MVRRRRINLKRKRKWYRQKGRGFGRNCWGPRKQLGKGGGKYIYQLWGL